MILVLSLFPGVGLLDRAFEEEGFAVVRGPDVLWGGDVRIFHPPPGRFDGVIGGPPCQAFSTLANLVRSKGFEPRFGNLIPEFVRCVMESKPRFFLMENVARAPIPMIDQYAAHSFTLDNAALGEEQERVRRFTFGVRGLDRQPIDIRRWIQLAPLMLPARAGSVTSAAVNNSQQAKGRVGTVTYKPAPGARELSPRRTPLRLGGTGKPKGYRQVAVTAAHPGDARPKGGHLIVYDWPEMCRLQGLPPDFLVDAPFTMDGKRKALANGVPLPMGRAVARAVREAIANE
jgi:DNA (cytosine-5)-methyltransferase 1